MSKSLVILSYKIVTKILEILNIIVYILILNFIIKQFIPIL